MFKYQNFKISRFCNDNKLCIFAYIELICLICQLQAPCFLQIIKLGMCGWGNKKEGVGGALLLDSGKELHKIIGKKQ